MKKVDLINAIIPGLQETDFGKKLEEKKVNVSKKDATELVDIILDAAMAGLKEDKVLDLYGFCKMTVEHKDERVGRNPQTGEDMKVPAKDVPKCKFSKTLKDYINE